jgi:hypothetical protein
VDTVRIDVTEPPAGTFTVVGLKLNVIDGSEVDACRLTGPEKPPRLPTVMLGLPCSLGVRMTGVLGPEMLKSPPFTTTIVK